MYKNTIMINTSKFNHNVVKREIMGTKIMKPNKYGYFEDCLEGFLHFSIENDNYDLDEIIYYIVSLGFKEAEIEIYDDEFMSNLVYSTILPYSIEKTTKTNTFSTSLVFELNEEIASKALDLYDKCSYKNYERACSDLIESISAVAFSDCVSAQYSIEKIRKMCSIFFAYEHIDDTTNFLNSIK